MSRISWQSIIAGVFVTMAIYSTLLFLGLGLGASSAQQTIQEGGNVTDLTKGTATWITVATLISLAAGGYFTTRFSSFVSRMTGAAQGLVLASVFLAIMIYGVGQTVGAGIRGMTSAVEVGATGLLNSPMVQNTVEDALGSLQLKSDPQTVVRGLVSRLASGNTESARAYLINQSNASETVVDQQFATIQTQFKETAKTVGSATASGVSSSGYGVFWISFLGILCACAGGAGGARVNARRPFEVETKETRRFEPRTAV